MGLPLSFFLPKTARSLLFEMEWRFDVQIEDGLLYLGHRPDGPVCTTLNGLFVPFKANHPSLLNSLRSA
jgi:hypothetical protein